MDRKSLIASLDILSKNFTENDPMAKDLRTIACAISKMQDAELASRMASDAPSFEGVAVEAAKTFKCPTCGTNVLEQTGYCVKCKKKVKKACVCGESACDGKCEDKKEEKDASVTDFWSKEASDRVAMALVTEVVGMNQNERAEKNWPSKGKAEKDAAKVEPEVEEEEKPVVDEKDAAKKVEEKPEEVKPDLEAAKKEEVKPEIEEEKDAAKKVEEKPEEVDEKDAAKKEEVKPEIEEEKKSTVDTDILASMTYGDISMAMPMGMLSNEVGDMTAAEKEMLEGLFTKN